MRLREYGIELVDFRDGNIGYGQGQVAEFTVRLPAGDREVFMARARALQLAVTTFARGSDDVRECRLRFLDGNGKRVAESLVDMSAAAGLTDGDEAAMAAYAAAYSRSREFE